MRNRIFALAVVMALLWTPPAAAHGPGGFGHLNVDVAELAAGETKTYHLDPSNEGENITLSQGWVFGVYGALQAQDARIITVELSHEGISLANWTWTGGYHGNTTRLHFTGEYELRIHNPNPSSVRYAIYYDQSCNCKGKMIPLPGGWNLFNYDLPGGRDVELGFPMARTYHVRGALALLNSDEDARWPQDFRILEEREAKGPAWLNFTFKTEKAQRYFVYVEAVEGATLEEPLQLTPLLVVSPEESPGPTVGPIVLFLGLAAVVAWRRRGTGPA